MTDCDWGQSKVGRPGAAVAVRHSPMTAAARTEMPNSLCQENRAEMPPPKERERENKNGFWKRKFEEESLAKDAAKDDVGNDGANKEKKKTQQKLEWSSYPKVKSLSRRTNLTQYISSSMRISYQLNIHAWTGPALTWSRDAERNGGVAMEVEAAAGAVANDRVQRPRSHRSRRRHAI